MPASRNCSVQTALSANLVRADALILMVDLAEDPLAQMEALTTELGRLRIGLGPPPEEEEEDQPRYKKALVIGNKIDLEGAERNFVLLKELIGQEFPVLGVSAQKGTGLEDLRAKIFEMLDIIRVYTKSPGQKPDMNDPIVLERGSTLEDAAEEVHKDFSARLKFARVWGSGKHDGVMVKRDHVLQDGDIIELHM
jgi:ribosome-interacting GTPase 1